MSATNNQLGSLTEMIAELILEYPNQPKEAIREYLKNIETDKNTKRKELREKLTKDKNYLLEFQKAISYTSIFLYLTSRKAQLLCTPELAENPTTHIDYDLYQKDFLKLSKDDDLFIKEMKIYHLQSLTSEEMFGELDREQYDSEDEYLTALKKHNKIKISYDSLLRDFVIMYIQQS